MLSEEFIRRENWLHFSDDLLNFRVITTTLDRWHGTFSKNATIVSHVVNNDYQKVLHINHYIRLQDYGSQLPPKKEIKRKRQIFALGKK